MEERERCYSFVPDTTQDHLIVMMMNKKKVCKVTIQVKNLQYEPILPCPHKDYESGPRSQYTFCLLRFSCLLDVASSYWQQFGKHVCQLVVLPNDLVT
jgi:hypothetical protein